MGLWFPMNLIKWYCNISFASRSRHLFLPVPFPRLQMQALQLNFHLTKGRFPLFLHVFRSLCNAVSLTDGPAHLFEPTFYLLEEATSH